MTSQQLLIEAFDYDLWANRKWLEFLPQFTQAEREVFDHILMAQELWADRISGNSPTEFPVVEPNAENLDRLHSTWIAILQTRNLEETVDYHRTNGDSMHSVLHLIVRHVANHGTYHRGHLRGLCQARNCTDFPETDFILFDPAK